MASRRGGCLPVAPANTPMSRRTPSPMSRGTLCLLFASTVAGYTAPAFSRMPAAAAIRAPNAATCARGAAPSMGVPKFFRWLTERFPQINRRISEGRRSDEYVDNFYLDMNGIIHTCTHGDGIQPGESLNEDEMLKRIFQYTERLIKIAKPRKLCYLAIDGVAPRAKMNQQRSRRYRAPREAAQQALIAQRNGKPVSDKPAFDSNCITPGTEFLASLGERYKEWIETSRADPNSNWCHDGLTVVFSGADVVGEGEHKIMDFIRDGRASGDFDEATCHCMYGLDADLIMLGMVTHAPKFCLLRERQKFQTGRYAPRGRKGGGGANEGRNDRGIRDRADVVAEEEANRDFIFLEVDMLRTLMAGSLRPRADYRPSDAAAAAALEAEEEVSYSDERLVDDFVFMCMLVGNDFLPGMPHLDVADGALNLMMRASAPLPPASRHTQAARPRPLCASCALALRAVLARHKLLACHHDRPLPHRLLPLVRPLSPSLGWRPLQAPTPTCCRRTAT